MSDTELIKYWLFVLTSLVIFLIIHSDDDNDNDKDKDKDEKDKED